MNPIKNAESVLKNYCIKKREDLNLENILDGERLMLEEEDLDNHLGRICFKKNFGLIKIDKKIKEPGQKIFTIAHELGHYFNERNIDKYLIYNCTFNDLSSFSTQKLKEKYANIFAAELLMHKPWFLQYTINREINFELIKEIAEYFNVSLTAAAIRYAEIGQNPIAVVLSRNGAVAWSYISSYFPLKYIPKGYVVRKESAAYDFFKGREVQTSYDILPAYVWFAEDYKCQADVYLCEQNIVMHNYQCVLTMLWIKEF